MQKLLKVISNELENTRFELESELDATLKNEELSMAEKKERAIELLAGFAIAEVSNNLWTMYTTPPKEQEGDVQGPEVEPETTPKA